MERFIEAAVAKYKSGSVPFELVAVVIGSTRANDLDGERWKFIVFDGVRYGFLEAELTDSERCSTPAFDDLLLETAVERRLANGYYRDEFLLNEVVADGSIALHRDDFRSHPERGGPGSIFFFG